MRRLLTLCLALAMVLSLGTATMAAFDIDIGLGARAMGMGGAFVAIADDGTAPYWNPAGITQIKLVGITPTLALNGDFVIPETEIGSGFPPDFGNLDLQLGAMVGVLFKGVGFSVILDADANTYYDGVLSYGGTSVCGTGMLTLAHEFGEVFAVGANIKVLYMGSLDFEAESGTPSGGYREGTGQGYALDVGVMVKLGEIVRLGAVYENIVSSVEMDSDYYDYVWDGVSSYEWVLDYSEHEEGELLSLFRVGAAFKIPVVGTLIAVQMDYYDDADFAIYRIGVEQSLLVLKLRGGAVLDEDFDVMQYTAGLGFKLGPVVLDVAAVADADFELKAAVLTAGIKF